MRFVFSIYLLKYNNYSLWFYLAWADELCIFVYLTLFVSLQSPVQLITVFPFSIYYLFLFREINRLWFCEYYIFVALHVTRHLYFSGLFQLNMFLKCPVPHIYFRFVCLKRNHLVFLKSFRAIWKCFHQ